MRWLIQQVHLPGESVSHYIQPADLGFDICSNTTNSISSSVTLPPIYIVPGSRPLISLRVVSKEYDSIPTIDTIGVLNQANTRLENLLHRHGNTNLGSRGLRCELGTVGLSIWVDPNKEVDAVRLKDVLGAVKGTKSLVNLYGSYSKHITKTL